MMVTLDTSHVEMSPLNDVAPRNIADMSVTLDTSHFQRSLLNNFAKANMRVMSLMLDASHSPIGPCLPSAQSPLGDTLRHSITAALSSSSDCGENDCTAEINGGEQRMSDRVYSIRSS